jgi:hypothetical protein
VEIAGSNPARVAIVPSARPSTSLIFRRRLLPARALWFLAAIVATEAVSPPIALAGAASPPTALAGDGRGPEARRGPSEIRDGHLLAQPRLTLPATSPHTVPAGSWALDVSFLWSSSFAWTQDVPGEHPADRSFLIDGETHTLAVTLRRGLSTQVDVGVRLPLQHRGGGVLDAFIDAWHRTFRLADGARPAFRRDAFRIEGRTTDGRPFSWNTDPGVGLGSIQADLRWRWLDRGRSNASAALVGRVSLPTGTSPYDADGLGAGAQLVLGAPLGRTTDLYAGGGLSLQDPGPVRGLEYVPVRTQGFAAFEWRPWGRVSLVAETDVASRLVRNIDSYPGVHWLVNLGGRIDVGHKLRLDIGLTENLIDQQSTTDFGLFLAVGWRP